MIGAREHMREDNMNVRTVRLYGWAGKRDVGGLWPALSLIIHSDVAKMRSFQAFSTRIQDFLQESAVRQYGRHVGEPCHATPQEPCCLHKHDSHVVVTLYMNSVSMKKEVRTFKGGHVYGGELKLFRAAPQRIAKTASSISQFSSTKQQ